MLAWRDFLNTETGRRVVGKALESVPTLLAGGNVNEILIRSGEVRGWSAAAQAFLSLAAPLPKPPEAPPAFPDLDDDAKWSDSLTP